MDAKSKAVPVKSWLPQQVIAVIVAVTLGVEVFLVFVAPKLLLCFSTGPANALMCMDLELQNGAWTMTQVQNTINILEREGFIATTTATEALLARLPNLGNTTVAQVFLALVESGTLAISGWQIKKNTNVGHPAKGVQDGDIICLRDNVRDFLKTHKINRKDFAEACKISINTLNSFLNSSKDTQETIVAKIKATYERLSK